MTPTKPNDRPEFLKEPGGMVVVKLPTWSLTASVRGLIPMLAVNARKGTPSEPGGMMPDELGKDPTATVATTVFGFVGGSAAPPRSRPTFPAKNACFQA